MNTLKSNTIRHRITANALALKQAREDAETFERLRKAGAEVTRLNKLADQLTSELNDALADEARQERKRIADSLRHVEIVTSYPSKLYPSGLLNARFTINFDRLSYDASAHKSVWRAHSVQGFDTLPSEVLGFILDQKPELLPAIIRELAPGNPRAALERYAVAMRRGYVAGNA